MNSIGAGHFGSVSKGLWFNGHSPVDVAIKKTKDANEQERVKLLQEAAIMGQFAHNNVVRLHGVVTVEEPVSIYIYIHVHVSMYTWIDSKGNLSDPLWIPGSINNLCYVVLLGCVCIYTDVHNISIDG